MRFSDLSSQQQQYCTNLERMEKSSSTTQSPTIFIEEEKVNPTCSLPSPFSSEGASAPGNDDHGGFGGDAHPLAVFSSQSIIASSSSRSFESSIIPVGWEPGNWDVICQRGKECFEHGTFICLCLSQGGIHNNFQVAKLIPHLCHSVETLQLQLVIVDSVCVLRIISRRISS